LTGRHKQPQSISAATKKTYPSRAGGVAAVCGATAARLHHRDVGDGSAAGRGKGVMDPTGGGQTNGVSASLTHYEKMRCIHV
jgi:hypothetical protein